MMNKKVIYGGISIVIIMGAVLISMYLINAKPTPRKNALKHNTMYVKAQKVKMVEKQSDMHYRGRITAYDKVALSSEVQGVILQGDVRFKTGESFRKGQVLIQIYNEDVKVALKSGKSTFLQALSKILPDLKVDYTDEYEKWYTFFSSLEIDQPLPVLPEIKSDKEKVFLAANNVLTSYYSLQQQEIRLQKYTIKAPFSGIFTQVNKEIGSVASPGSALATIIRSDKLEVTVPVFPKDIKWIIEGNKVSIKNNTSGEKMATVSRISQFVDEATQSVNVYLTYSTKQHSGFLHGEYVDVNFKGAKATGFEIPREALFDGKYVYELKDKALNKIAVTIERKLHDSYLISGLDSSQIIVVESLASVNSNTDYIAR